MTSTGARAGTVALVTLGCARNEVDSEELAARLAAAGWQVVDDADSADAVLVNTCGFVDVAKKDSIDTILAVSDSAHQRARPGSVVAVGCLAERYGAELAAELPEADAVLGFDDYPEIADRLRRVVAGEHLPAHTPSDRRRLLPITPVERPGNAAFVPGHGEPVDTPVPGWQPPILRRRLDGSPVAPVKLASGCDRRCAFCAIPSFRGSFISRPAADVLAEIVWLADQDVREIVLVSENSTSYGKDLGDLRLLEALLAGIDSAGAVGRVRVAYLQPAEVRPSLLAAIAGTPGIADYFDLSFQHASATVLRRMRRFGGRESFVDLIAQIRALAPQAGIRTNVIVGFPGETAADVEELCEFLVEARLDAIGVFGYSDEDGTEAVGLPDKVPADVIRERVEQVTALAEEVMAQRAEDRIGQPVRILVEEVTDDGSGAPVGWGRAEHQGPDDGGTRILVGAGTAVGDFVDATVVAVDGVDLVASADPAP